MQDMRSVWMCMDAYGRALVCDADKLSCNPA